MVIAVLHRGSKLPSVQTETALPELDNSGKNARRWKSPVVQGDLVPLIDKVWELAAKRDDASK